MRRGSAADQFGPRAEAYARSAVHARGESLERLVSLLRPPASARVLDVATGAGHTALAIAPRVREVIAVDVTPEMLDVARRLAHERGIGNVRFEAARAEDIPFPSESFDIVTCRIAAHHFTSVPGFVAEAARVLMGGGRLAIVDNVVPEDPTVAGYVDAIETVRDRSHERYLAIDEWRHVLTRAGFEIDHVETLRKRLDFRDWAERMGLDHRTTEQIRRMIVEAPTQVLNYLEPEHEGARLYFTLSEAVIIARKPGRPPSREEQARIQAAFDRASQSPSQPASYEQWDDGDSTRALPPRDAADWPDDLTTRRVPSFAERRDDETRSTNVWPRQPAEGDDDDDWSTASLADGTPTEPLHGEPEARQPIDDVSEPEPGFDYEGSDAWVAAAADEDVDAVDPATADDMVERVDAVGAVDVVGKVGAAPVDAVDAVDMADAADAVDAADEAEEFERPDSVVGTYDEPLTGFQTQYASVERPDMLQSATDRPRGRATVPDALVSRESSGAVIQTIGLTKYYGKTRGIVDLNLTVWAGEVFGFLGPNGAGKTTTIRLLLDLIRPTRGASQVLGVNPRDDGVNVRRRIGYLPGELALHEDMKVRHILEHFGHLRGGVEWDYVVRLADRLELDLSRKIGALSRGNKQKVGIVQAFMHRPDVLILDEPTSGLDPLVQLEFYALLSEANAEGRTVFLSSHVLPEIERVADRVGIVRDGHLVAVRDIKAIKADAHRTLELWLGAPPPKGLVESLPEVSEAEIDGLHVTLKLDGEPDRVLTALSPYQIVDLRTPPVDLESLFLRYYREEVHEA